MSGLDGRRPAEPMGMFALTPLAILLLALASSGCATPGPKALRHPHFRPSEIRRPAVVLQVSVDHTGFLGQGEFSRQERDSVPEAFELTFLDKLNAEGILPVDVTVVAQRDYRAHSTVLERIDRNEALKRARALKADTVLILDARLSRGNLVYCPTERRPFVARTTFWSLAADVVRVADGTHLLIEPPGPALRVGNVEPDCERGRISRSLSSHELLEAAVQRAVSLLLEE